MKQQNRERVTERAIQIVETQRDMGRCAEEFTLYNSAHHALDASLQMILLTSSLGEANFENRSVSCLRTTCITESWRSCWTCSDIRKAVADALKLAKKELSNEC